MKGYTIQKSIDLLEKAVENGGGSSGETTAANVSYDNTASGMTADDVQDAIDELDTAIETVAASIPTVPDLFPQDNLEHSIGNNLYVKRFADESMALSDIVLIEGLDGVVVNSYGTVSNDTYVLPLNLKIDTTNYSEIYQVKSGGNVILQTGTTLRGAYEVYVIYRKNPAPVTNTRKKGGK